MMLDEDDTGSLRPKREPSREKFTEPDRAEQT